MIYGLPLTKLSESAHDFLYHITGGPVRGCSSWRCTMCVALVLVEHQIVPGDTRGRGSRPLLNNHKNIGFPSNINLDRLKITKRSSHHSILCHYQHASKTRWPTFSSIWILHLSPQLK